jgi:hypothetical protein
MAQAQAQLINIILQECVHDQEFKVHLHRLQGFHREGD